MFKAIASLLKDLIDLILLLAIFFPHEKNPFQTSESGSEYHD